MRVTGRVRKERRSVGAFGSPYMSWSVADATLRQARAGGKAIIGRTADVNFGCLEAGAVIAMVPCVLLNVGFQSFSDAANITLIGLIARFALEHGYHTIVEGILYAAHYGDMLSGLIASHTGLTRCYYLDVPFDETVRRHATKPQAASYGAAEMRSWYRERDLLPGGSEEVIPASSTLAETVGRIMDGTGLS